LATATVNIRNLAFGGDGVGEVIETDSENSTLGIAAFVPFTIPGEKTRIHISEEKKRYLRGDITELLEISPARVEPECKYFGNCGGCEIQHIHYDDQLKFKREMISGALRAGRLPAKVVEALKDIVPSSPFNYRRRVTLHVSESGLVGFYRERSRSIVSIERCPIAVDAISELLPKLPTFTFAVKGKISSIVLESDAAGVVAVLKSAYALTKRDREIILGAAKQVFESALLLSGSEAAGGFGREILELPLSSSDSFTLQVPAGNFSQINLEINRALVEYVTSHAEIGRGDSVIDLYAGAGNFSLPLARLGGKVTAVEVDKRLVQLGKQNALRLRLDKQVTFYESSVEKFLSKPQTAPKLLVCDPPRSGLGPMANKLPNADRVILISCHLPSCVRDLMALTEAGYEVLEIQPFDMFAQTTYVEIASVLVKRK